MDIQRFLEKINVKCLVYIMTGITLLYTLVFTLLHNLKFDGYILGDWLINYQDGGFKRRGLSGSFFFILQDLTGFRLNYLVFLFQFLIISFFFYTYFKIIKFKKLDLAYLSLLLSPIGFVGLFNTVDYAGKKEFIIFLLFAYWVYWISTNRLSRAKENAIVLGLFISMFFHEITLFFVPYFIMALYCREAQLNYRVSIKLLTAVLLPAIAIVLFGGAINEGHSIDILKDRGVVVTRGIFFWNIDERDYLIKAFDDYRWYLLSFTLSFGHIAFYLKLEGLTRKYGYWLVGAFLFSLPLFLLAIDWGRWMYIHMMFMIILFPMLKPTSTSMWDYTAIRWNKVHLAIGLIILFSLFYRVEMSGRGFTFQGLFYRLFLVPSELIHKMM